MKVEDKQQTGRYSTVRCTLNWLNKVNNIMPGLQICYLICTNKNLKLKKLKCTTDGDIGDYQYLFLDETSFFSRFTSLQMFSDYLVGERFTEWDIKGTIDGMELEFWGKVKYNEVFLLYARKDAFNYQRYLEGIERESYSE